MHSDQIVDISRVGAGEIAALFGVDCESGATFGSAEQKKLLSSMNVPEPVISLAVILKNTKNAEKFSKALKRFQREDPTFKVSTDEETKELLFSGMGELHLEIYLERLRREYNCDTQVFAFGVTCPSHCVKYFSFRVFKF